MRIPQKSRRGAGLVIALLTLAVTGIFAAAAASAMKTLMRDTLYQERLLEAQALAESGAEDALAHLARDGSWREGFREKPFQGGYYDVTITSGPIPVVTAVGFSRPLTLFGRARRMVKFKAFLLPNIHIEHAVAANEMLFLYGGNSSIDSYESDNDRDPSHFGSHAHVLTNNKLVIDGQGLTIFGDATYGAGPPPPAGTVTGNATKSPYPIPLVPEDGSAYIQENDNQTGLQPSYVYNTGSGIVTVPAQVAATLRSGVYYWNGLKIEGVLKADVSKGPVVIFLKGFFYLGGKFENPSHLPANLLIFGQGSGASWTLAGGNPFHGVLHAPTHNITVSQPIFGTLFGNNISIQKNAVHHDLSLRNPTNYGSRVAPNSWKGNASD